MVLHLYRRAALAAFATALLSAPAAAQPLAMNEPAYIPRNIFQEVMPSERAIYERETLRYGAQPRYEAERMPRYEALPQDSEPAAEMPAHLRRQVVAYSGREAPGTIVVDTANTYLYYVLGNGQAMRYGIGVGREGFTWAGTQPVARKAEWPDWHPPAEMIARQPYLPRFMAGGPGNPLGARALYLGNSMYRIHGTNEPHTIGRKVSSGCIRMLNEDVTDLYQRVRIGTRVVVLPDGPRWQEHNLADRQPQRPQGYAGRGSVSRIY